MSEATRSEACAKPNIRQYSNEVIGEFIAVIIVEDTIIVEIKRKVRDFDEDLSRFQRDQKSLFERPKLLQIFYIVILLKTMHLNCKSFKNLRW